MKFNTNCVLEQSFCIWLGCLWFLWLSHQLMTLVCLLISGKGGNWLWYINVNYTDVTVTKYTHTHSHTQSVMYHNSVVFAYSLFAHTGTFARVCHDCVNTIEWKINAEVMQRSRFQFFRFWKKNHIFWFWMRTLSTAKHDKHNSRDSNQILLNNRDWKYSLQGEHRGQSLLSIISLFYIIVISLVCVCVCVCVAGGTL